MSLRLLVLAGLGSLVAVLLAPLPATAQDPLVNLIPPAITGDPHVGERILVDAGAWSAEPVDYDHQWLRDGTPIAGAERRAYRPVVDDLGHRLSVLVTATDAAGNQGSATTPEAAPTALGELRVKAHPRVVGDLRFGQVVRVTLGRWKPQPTRVRFQWYRGEAAIHGATARTHRLGVADVGSRLKARVYVKRPGYDWAQITERTGVVGYRVPVRRTVTYRIETRGHLTTSVKDFARLAAQTYADPRGWRNAGVAFKRVNGPSDFSLVLAEASWLPRFSSVCSVQWSCRAGRYVVINQTRWKSASPSWNSAGKSLRDYRHLVVNHETGHWLGHGHLGCPGPGRLAPVMMQQSKGLNGCVHNPWPLGGELWFR